MHYRRWVSGSKLSPEANLWVDLRICCALDPTKEFDVFVYLLAYDLLELFEFQQPCTLYLYIIQ